MIKKKNPTDLNFLKKVTISKRKYPTDNKEKVIIYTIFLGKTEIGYAEIIEGRKYLDAIHIEPEYKRKGLATVVYNYIERDLNIKLKPSDYIEPDGKKFWESRLKFDKGYSI